MKRFKRVVHRRRSASTGPESVVTLSVPRTDLTAIATDLGLPPTKSGLLLKYTNVVKRWKTRHFTLENGVLVYSAPSDDDIDDIDDQTSTPSPIATATNFDRDRKHRRKGRKKRILRHAHSKDEKDRDIKGQINLQFAVVSADDSDSTRFVIDLGNDVFHCKAESSEERDDWVNVLNRSIEYFRGLIERAIDRAKDNTTAVADFAESPHLSNAIISERSASTPVTPHEFASAPAHSEESEESVLEDDGLKEAERSRKALLTELRRILTLWREHWIATNTNLTDAHVLRTLAQTFQEVSSLSPSPINSASQSREIAKGLIDLVTWCAHILQTNDQMFDRRLNADITRLMGNGLPVFPTSPRQFAAVPSVPESDFPTIDSDSDDEFVDALSRAASKRSSFAKQLGLVEPHASPTSVSPLRLPTRKPGNNVNNMSPVNGIRRVSTSLLSKSLSSPRTHLPSLSGPKEKFNIFGILKDSIGKDLSKIPFPLGLNEPISFVQRLAEDIEYCELLDKGAAESDQDRRMMYVAAMVISHYSSTQGRVGKPFNPLLGETACLVRPDKGKGVRFIAEQVSHHPPISASYAEGSGGSWKYYNAIEIKNKFWGKSLEVFPTGLNHIEFPEHGDHYVLEQVTSCVHNIVVGRMWLDNYGEMEIVNRTNGGRCVITFAKTGWMSDASSFAGIKGVVYNKDGEAVIKLGGNWTKHVYEDLGKGKKNMIWTVSERPPEGASQSYNMTKWAISLNPEVTEEERKLLPPTDSRLRPDQRALERGQYDFGSRLKQALEDGQRKRRRDMEEAGQEWAPLWFEKVTDERTGQTDFRYTDKFFRQQSSGDWSVCPDLFSCASVVEA